LNVTVEGYDEKPEVRRTLKRIRWKGALRRL
jgi:hypothetical protein